MPVLAGKTLPDTLPEKSQLSERSVLIRVVLTPFAKGEQE